MLRNHLKIAYRNLKRRPGYTAINVGGLAVGMAARVLIINYVQQELSYNDFHENADRIWAVGKESASWGRSLATVSYHALRTAWTNPADAPRYE
jgi:putative ABC transport system permease protein